MLPCPWVGQLDFSLGNVLGLELGAALLNAGR